MVCALRMPHQLVGRSFRTRAQVYRKATGNYHGKFFFFFFLFPGRDIHVSAEWRCGRFLFLPVQRWPSQSQPCPHALLASCLCLWVRRAFYLKANPTFQAPLIFGAFYCLATSLRFYGILLLWLPNCIIVQTQNIYFGERLQPCSYCRLHFIPF